jgi:hypothetical protein
MDAHMVACPGNRISRVTPDQQDRTPDEWLKIVFVALVVVGAAAIAIIAWLLK